MLREGQKGFKGHRMGIGMGPGMASGDGLEWNGIGWNGVEWSGMEWGRAGQRQCLIWPHSPIDQGGSLSFVQHNTARNTESMAALGPVSV